MAVWWVNQGSTYESSNAHACLWAPLKTSRGVKLTYWETMTEVEAGDIIVHCSKGKVRALSMATSGAYRSMRPDRFESESWIVPEGTRVDIDPFPLKPEISVDSVAAKIQALNIFQGPLNKNGKPKQSYLHRFSIDGLKILQGEFQGRWPEWAR